MMKKTLIAAAALTVIALGAASPASAHYNGYRYNFSYGGYPWGNSYAYKAYNYQPSCHHESRPVTLKIWDDYSYSYYFKTVYRDIKVCG